MEKNKNMFELNDGLKKSPFSTPDGYFEQLPTLIQERCAKPEKAKKRWVAFVPQVGVAVAFVVVVFFAKGVLNMADQPTDRQQAGVVALHDTAGTNANTETIVSPDMVNDVVVSYLVDRNISDLDIAQSNL